LISLSREHAGNAAMLHSLGITHVVSVGESLITCPPDCDPMYGQVGPNTLAAEHAAGRIQVCDLNDVRDDGNDPLRPLIAKACTWIEQARRENGVVLVHCVSGKGGRGRKSLVESGRVGLTPLQRVGVSRSASIVIAYMMQYLRMGLMDAYLVTRARRLNGESAPSAPVV
jgi:dual specificity MAP kinase phosphatase